MTRSKRASHTRRSTPVRLASRIHAHIPPSRRGPRYHRHNLKQKYSPKSCGYEDDSEDTYLSFLRGIRDTGNDDDDDNDNDAGSNGTGLDASSDGEELDEETTLVEMLGSSYSNPYSPIRPDFCSSEGSQRIQRRRRPSGAPARVRGRFTQPT